MGDPAVQLRSVCVCMVCMLCEDAGKRDKILISSTEGKRLVQATLPHRSHTSLERSRKRNLLY